MKANELNHAAQCLEIYLRNEREIYERYTLEAVASVVDAKRKNDTGGARLDDETAWNNLAFWISWQPCIKKAIQAAAKLVRKYDYITPTAEDIETVRAGYVSDIIDKAKYELISDKRKILDGLKYELQQYYDNASKGMPETRRRNMVLLRWDIRKLENEIKKYM